MSTINFAQKLAHIFVQDHESICFIVQLAIPEFGAGFGNADGSVVFSLSSGEGQC